MKFSIAIETERREYIADVKNFCTIVVTNTCIFELYSTGQFNDDKRFPYSEFTLTNNIRYYSHFTFTKQVSYYSSCTLAMYRYNIHTVTDMWVSSPYNYLNRYDLSYGSFSRNSLHSKNVSNSDRVRPGSPQQCFREKNTITTVENRNIRCHVIDAYQIGGTVSYDTTVPTN